MTPEEYKETMKTLAQDENLLPGIYNFCDQWCEKCAWPDRCFTHRMGVLADRPMEEKRIDDPEFWEDISNSFSATGLMLKEQAEEFGIDLDNLVDENGLPLDEPEDKDDPYSTGNWPDFIKMADDYGFAVLGWIQKNNLLIRENLMSQLNISEEKAGTAVEAFETIQNYALFISSKMRVAFSIIHDEPAIMTDDANGMMKIAIETTDRSIYAFLKLWEIMPDQEKTILDFLRSLEVIRNKANEKFPNAGEFDYFRSFTAVR